jgi:hypothetical protein
MIHLKIDKNLYLIKSETLFLENILFNIGYDPTSNKIINFSNKDNYLESKDMDIIYFSNNISKDSQEINLYAHDILRPSKKSSLIKSLYYFSFYFLKNKKIDLSKKLLNNLGDIYFKNLFKKEKFYILEQELMEAVENKSKRLVEGSDLKILGHKNFLEIVYPLIDKKDFKVFYPIDKIKNIDEFIAENDEPSEVLGFSWNSDLVNLSLTLKIKGKAKLPEGYERFGLLEYYPTFIYRNYPIIKNGNMCISEIYFNCGKESLESLRNQISNISEISEDKFKLDITLDNLVNLKNEDNIETVCSKIVELSKKEAIKKVFKEKSKEIKDNLNESSEEIEFLKSAGVTSNGFFKKTEKNPETFIEVLEFKSYLKGISSLPKVSDVIKKIKDNKSLTPREKIIQEALNLLESADEGYYSKLKKDIYDLENYINTFKLKRILEKKWINGDSLENISESHNSGDYQVIFEVLNKKIKK